MRWWTWNHCLHQGWPRYVAEPEAHGAHVLGPVAEVGIVQAPENLAEFLHRFFQRPGRADLAVADARERRADKARVAGKLHLGRDDFVIVGEGLGHARARGFELRAHAGRGRPQGLLLKVRVRCMAYLMKRFSLFSRPEAGTQRKIHMRCIHG